MAITAQDLDRRITLQRASSVNNEFNEPVQTWTDLATVWARRRDASDRQVVEVFAAGQVGSFLISRFTVRSNDASRDFKPIDRVLHDGEVWNIKGIKEADEGRRRFLEITAVRDGD